LENQSITGKDMDKGKVAWFCSPRGHGVHAFC